MTAKDYANLVHQMRIAQQKYRDNRTDDNREEARRLARLVDAATDELRCIPAPSVLIELRQGRDPQSGELTRHSLSQITVTHPIKLLQVLDLLAPLFFNLVELEKEYPGQDFSELPVNATTHAKSA